MHLFMVADMENSKRSTTAIEMVEIVKTVFKSL